MVFRKKTSLISPIADLFIVMTIVFMAAAAFNNGGGGGGGNTSNQIMTTRGGMFKFNDSAIAIESTLQLRQLFYNIFYEIDSAIQGDRGIFELKHYYRLTANSDPLDDLAKLDNWTLSLNRAKSVYSLGMTPEKTFVEEVIVPLLGSLKPDSGRGIAHLRQSLKDISSSARNNPDTIRWIFSTSCYDKTPDSYFLIWVTGELEKKHVLLKMQSDTFTAWRLKAAQELPSTFKSLINYKEQYPKGAIDLLQAHAIIEEGIIFSSLVKIRSKDKQWINTESFKVADENRIYLPFFQLASVGSYDSSAYHLELKKECEAILRSISTNIVSERIEKTAKHLNMTADGDKSNFYFRSFLKHGEDNATFFEDNKEVLLFLISNQFNRSLSIQRVEHEVIDGHNVIGSKRIAYKLRDQADSIAQDSPLARSLTEAKTKPVIAERLALFETIQKHAKSMDTEASALYAQLFNASPAEKQKKLVSNEQQTPEAILGNATVTNASIFPDFRALR